MSRAPSCLRGCAAACLMVLCAGCALQRKEFVAPPPKPEQPKPEQPKPEAKRDGKYYKDDGPPDDDAFDWSAVPDPPVSFAPINPRYNRAYEVFGVRYVPFKNYVSYRQQGAASWYGKRYHGRKTSSGEVYDMFAMTAAHTILPIPSYARVTRVDDGRSVVVRINDRGPFLNERLIDLSYTAARKLGVVETGTAEVIVEAIVPDEPVRSAADAPVPEQQVPPSAKLPDAAANYIQLGAFSLHANAEKMLATLHLPTLALPDARVVAAGDLYRVVVGPYPDRLAAEQDLDRLHDLGVEALLKYF